MIKPAIALVIVVSVGFVSGCSSSADQSGAGIASSVTATPSTSPVSSAAPSGTAAATPEPVASSSPSAQALALTGRPLEAALLTPRDLGAGWAVKARTLKPATAKQKRSYSPECQDFVDSFASPVTKNDPDVAYVDMNTGEGFQDRSLTERIAQLPADGFEAYRDTQLALIDGCPQIISPSTGENSLSATIQITPLTLAGANSDSVGFLMTANAIFASYYIMSATVPVGGNLLTVQSSWAQKSKKTLEKYLRKAVTKLEAAQAQAANADANATPTSTP